MYLPPSVYIVEIKNPKGKLIPFTREKKSVISLSQQKSTNKVHLMYLKKKKTFSMCTVFSFLSSFHHHGFNIYATNFSWMIAMRAVVVAQQTYFIYVLKIQIKCRRCVPCNIRNVYVRLTDDKTATPFAFEHHKYGLTYE